MKKAVFGQRISETADKKTANNEGRLCKNLFLAQINTEKCPSPNPNAIKDFPIVQRFPNLSKNGLPQRHLAHF
jgi:hypothetical protein